MKPLPGPFQENMHRLLGEEFTSFASCLDDLPPVSIRLHPLKYQDTTTLADVPWSATGRYLSERPSFTLDPLFHAGAYYVQEASSMFLEQAVKQTVDLSRPLNVLDLCAAPGGKSTHILSMINRDSLLVTNEVIRSRASILAENIQKWGYPNAVVTNNDPGDFRKLPGFFDVVVVDAPCSGEGLFRKDPEAMDKWSPGNVQLCCGRQQRILSEAWDTLKENGILVYCTCTYNKAEDEGTLQWLQEHYDVEFQKLVIEPEWQVLEVDEANVIGYRFFPHRVRGEGFFLSVIKKRSPAPSAPLTTKKAILTPSPKIRDRVSEWMTDPASAVFYQFNDLIFYTPASKAAEVEFLLQHFHILYAGTNMATLKHDKLIPDHALALSVDLRKQNFPTADLSEPDAIKYLRKDTLQLKEIPTGFTLITHNDIPLGWANVLPNRVNNMYPSDWRIRKTIA